MQEHGTYDISLIDDIVEVIPKGGFNEFGIQKLRSDILDYAPQSGPWALFERPKEDAGLTPEAVAEIAKSYEIFSQKGCIIIALEINTTWGSIFLKPPFSELNIPVLIGDNADELMLKLNAALSATSN